MSSRAALTSLLAPAIVAAAIPVAVSPENDAFLTGYAASILERDLQWERGSYLLKVVEGVARITLFTEDPVRREAASTRLRELDGIRDVVVEVKVADERKPGWVSRLLGVTGEVDGLPAGDVFQPLLADPKQPHFFASLNRFTFDDERYTMASVGFGESFGMFRVLGNREGDGLQLSLEGGLFAQFNLSAPSSALLNADYVIGFPLTYRRNNSSVRLRVFHQSSHLGDELLLSGEAPERVNLSYEAVDLIYSYDWRGWRIYAGGGYLYSREPQDLKPRSTQWGLEYRASEPLIGTGRFVAGVDMKRLEAHDWETDTSIKTGLEFGYPRPGQRRLRLMLEWYQGRDPHGQFYRNRVEYGGVGIALGF